MKQIEVVAAIIRDAEGRVFATQRGCGESQDYTYIPGLERGWNAYKPRFATWEELMQ